MANRFGDNITWTLNDDKLTLTGTGRIEEYGPRISCRVLEIGEGITSIEKNAFREHYSLREVILPKSLKYIDDYAFFDCHYLEKIDPLPPLNRISKKAFERSSVKDIYEAVLAAGPMIVDYEDFLETTHFPMFDSSGARFSISNLDVPEELREILRDYSYEEQLALYVFDGKALEDGERVDGVIEPPLDLVHKLLVKDGAVLGFTAYSDYYEPWIYVMLKVWEEYDWELREDNEYPYYHRYHPTMWIRSAREIYLSEEDTVISF